MDDNDSNTSELKPTPGFYATALALPKPEFRISALHVECPEQQPSRLIAYFDVQEERSGIMLHNCVAECEKGCWLVSWDLNAEVKWDDLHPLAAMKVAGPQHATVYRDVFEKALLAKVEERILQLFPLMDFESRFIPGFKEEVRELDYLEKRVPRPY